MDCSICCEKFNKSTHLKVECKSCTENIFACRSCCQTYLLSNLSNPKCMICKADWDKDFLLTFFTKKFINIDIKQLKENILLEKEISKLPETQEYAHNLKLIKSLEEQADIVNKSKNKLKLELLKLNKQYENIQSTINEIKFSMNTISSSKISFTYKCPVDDCNGFLNESYECGICDNKICKKCMEIKLDKHECDSDKIETIKLLKKDTKPCPKCGQLINKIDGCDQMWCPPCHTAFSWKTGMVEAGNIHNPEYYRWMRENNKDIPRNPGDEAYDPCANVLPSYMQLITTMRSHFAPKNDYNRLIDQNETITILNIHRLILHIQAVDREHNDYIRHEEYELRELRANYLLNKLTKDTWKKKLQMIDKKKEKKTKFNNVWNLLSMLLYEYIGKIMENKYNHTLKFIVTNIIKESSNIRKFCNNSFKKIGDDYKCVYPGITDKWIQIDNYKSYIMKK